MDENVHIPEAAHQDEPQNMSENADYCLEVTGAFEGSKKRLLLFDGLTKEEADRFANSPATVDALPADADLILRARKIPTRCNVVRAEDTEDGKMQIVECSKNTLWAEAQQQVHSDSDLRIVRRDAPRIATVFALCLAALACLGLVAFITWNAQGSDVPPTQTKTAEITPIETEAKQKSSVSVVVEALGATSEATDAKVLVRPSDGSKAVSELEIAPNQPASIGKLDSGDYELQVTAVPVCEDGSTFKLPEKTTRFTVSGDGKDVRLTVSLEPIAAEDMTEEDIEAAAATLDASGKADAASAVRQTIQGPDSVTGSEPSAPTGEASSGAPEPGRAPDSAGSGSDEGSGGGYVPPTEPTPDSGGSDESTGGGSSDSGSSGGHTCSFDIPIPGQVPIYGSVCWCGVPSPSPDHSMNHALNGESDRVLNGQIIGYQDGIVGWKCSCGAVS